VDISIGLPSTVRGLDGPALLDFARAADRAGFAALGVIDRLVYDNYDSLVSLSAAAAVTERIRLTSTVLLASYRGSGTVLAKQLASIDRLSGGRLVVGLSVGDRADDFEAAGAEFRRRGALLDTIVRELESVWSTKDIGPAPQPGGPPLLFGGHSPAAMRRAAQHGIGWIAGGSSGSTYRDLLTTARRQWTEAGRSGHLRAVALAYFCLGPNGRERAGDYLRDYYAYIGPKAEKLAATVAVTPDRIREVVADYTQAGCDELVLVPCAGDVDQVERLASAVLT
jgi:alkanesulfonate monooxygenase SsuD/methylene tetrahydromethanopterin reductase-like flavin-dependent oxidoreductase (luciferase family)